MSRYPQGRREQTRGTILASAARRMKQSGLVGSGVATLMSDAGLTNGAFYTHFASKEDLVQKVVDDQIHRQARKFDPDDEGAMGLVAVVDEYLSARHRDQPEEGCASAALLPEIARSTGVVRSSYTDALHDTSDAFRRLADMAAGESDADVLGVLAVLIGTLQLSRAVDDSDLSDAILREGRRNVLSLVAQHRERSSAGPA